MVKLLEVMLKLLEVMVMFLKVTQQVVSLELLGQLKTCAGRCKTSVHEALTSQEES